MHKHIACFALVVADYHDAIDFYVRKLGFELREDTDMGEGKRWVLVAPRGAQTAILLARAVNDEQRAAIGHQAGGRVGFFLHTDDFARDHASMVSHGVRFLEAPRHEAYGIVAVFEDLHGNRWDLLEPAA